MMVGLTPQIRDLTMVAVARRLSIGKEDFERAGQHRYGVDLSVEFFSARTAADYHGDADILVNIGVPEKLYEGELPCLDRELAHPLLCLLEEQNPGTTFALHPHMRMV